MNAIICSYMFCEVYRSHPWGHGWKPFGFNLPGPWVLGAGTSAGIIKTFCGSKYLTHYFRTKIKLAKSYIQHQKFSVQENQIYSRSIDYCFIGQHIDYLVLWEEKVVSKPLYILFNMAKTSCFQAVIDANIFPVLIDIQSKAEFKTRKEAAWAITNASSGGTAEQIRYATYC